MKNVLNTKHLLIGKRKPNNRHSKTGGVVILYENLIESFLLREHKIDLVDLNYRNSRFKKFSLPILLIQILFKIPRAKIVVFNGTANEFKYYAWFVVAISKLFNKKIVLRKFAGNFDEFFQYECGNVWKYAIRYSLKKADINYFETKYLVSYFSQFNKNCKHFPNVRNNPLTEKFSPNLFSKRFVFISQVFADKGINEILEARKNLPEDYVIDIYGPIMNSYRPPKDLKGTFNAIYKGVLNHNEVASVLSTYNVLLLPTYHKGEGYPGIIIEALSLGKPIVSTKQRGIKEMIADGESGFFVKEKSSFDLVKTIFKFNFDNYKKLSLNAYKSFSYFDQKIVMDRIFKELESLK